MKSLLNTALGLTLGVAGASFAIADGHAPELTIAIVNNGHIARARAQALIQLMPTLSCAHLGPRIQSKYIQKWCLCV